MQKEAWKWWKVSEKEKDLFGKGCGKQSYRITILLGSHPQSVGKTIKTEQDQCKACKTPLQKATWGRGMSYYIHQPHGRA